MKTKKPAVTRLTVARLYNVGNYEHVRYEITAEIPRGGSAKQTMLDLAAILTGLKPFKKPFDYNTAIETLNKQPDQLTEQEKGRLDEYSELLKQVEARKALRVHSLARLDDVGGTSKHTDAKQDWQDNDDYPF